MDRQIDPTPMLFEIVDYLCLPSGDSTIRYHPGDDDQRVCLIKSTSIDIAKTVKFVQEELMPCFPMGTSVAPPGHRYQAIAEGIVVLSALLIRMIRWANDYRTDTQRKIDSLQEPVTRICATCRRNEEKDEKADFEGCDFAKVCSDGCKNWEPEPDVCCECGREY